MRVAEFFMRVAEFLCIFMRVAEFLFILYCGLILDASAFAGLLRRLLQGCCALTSFTFQMSYTAKTEKLLRRLGACLFSNIL